jgi:hypothetical protein
MAPDVLPAFPSEAEEQLQYRRRPLDVRQSEPNASDALDDARPDAVADGCPSGHPDHLADAAAGKLADQELDVLLEDAHLACCSPQEPEAVPAPNTPDAGQSAEQSNAESAVPELDGPAAHFHPASEVGAWEPLASAAASELPTAYSRRERWTRQASPLSPLLREQPVLPASPLGAESEPQCAEPDAAAA